MTTLSTANKKAFAKLEGMNDEMLQEFVAESARRIIDRTPADSGTAKANWVINDTSTTSKEDPSGSATKGSISQKAATLKVGDKVTIQNNLSYIGVLEMGSSTHLPHGMVRRTANEADAISKKAMKKAEKKQ